MTDEEAEKLVLAMVEEAGLTPDCPPRRAFELAAYGVKPWTLEEAQHIRSCPYCSPLWQELDKESWHPNDETLNLYQQNRVPPSLKKLIETHLEAEQCLECQERYSQIKANGVSPTFTIWDRLFAWSRHPRLVAAWSVGLALCVVAFIAIIRKTPPPQPQETAIFQEAELSVTRPPGSSSYMAHGFPSMLGRMIDSNQWLASLVAQDPKESVYGPNDPIIHTEFPIGEVVASPVYIKWKKLGRQFQVTQWRVFSKRISDNPQEKPKQTDVPAQQTSINLGELAPGDYEWEVVAQVSGNQSDIPPASLKARFTVLPVAIKNSPLIKGISYARFKERSGLARQNLQIFLKQQQVQKNDAGVRFAQELLRRLDDHRGR